ncbi:G1 family glutamic endopeptidase [Streptomyces polygonati]|uniref:G1 family glutamic endopeptidase n=1 Tax=Streptomyces polygonati TaxID=1617087 RepID=A0ABV8HP54_9ACTN
MRLLRSLVVVALTMALALAGIAAAGVAAASGHTARTAPAARSRIESRPRIAAPTPARPAARPGVVVNGPRQLSTNWSGYAQQTANNGVTAVSSNWVQPWVDCRAGGAVATWVGIDGAQGGPFFTNVEQTGTSVDCSGGVPHYFGWYEMAPSPPVNYGNYLAPGDNMTASVTVANLNVYTLRLVDITQGWTENTVLTSSSYLPNNSAEAIVEAPTNAGNGQVLPLPDFGFTGFNGTTINGAYMTAANGNAIDLADPSGGTATTSDIGGPGYFTVTHGNAGNVTGTPKIAFQSSDLGGGLLHTSTPSGSGYLGQTIRAYTSPSIASLPGGGFEVAFVSNSAGGHSGVLTVYGTAFTFNTQLGVMANTSPAIAAAPDGTFEVVFQADTGQLWKYTPQTGGTPLGYPMLAGTSPSIAALAGGGYEIAFQANTGLLWEVGSYINFNTQLGMRAGTSPSIAASAAGGFQVAFQANTGVLWTQDLTRGGVSQGYAMAAGTSPSITALAAGGYETAFQASTGLLWEVGSYINFNTQLGMRAGTSPSITAVPGIVLEVAFQANSGVLWTQDLARGGVSQGQGMAANSGPAITG